MDGDIFGQTSSKSGEVNPLFLLYRDKLQNYNIKIQDRSITNSEIHDFLVSLHFILEYEINKFFREWMIFFYPHTFCDGKKQKQNIYFLDRVSFINKITMFVYLFPNEKVILSDFISKIEEFSRSRNSIFHGADLNSTYSLEDWNNIENKVIGKEGKTISYSLVDCEKQVELYEEILGTLKKVFLSSNIGKNNEDRQDVILNSIFT